MHKSAKFANGSLTAVNGETINLLQVGSGTNNRDRQGERQEAAQSDKDLHVILHTVVEF